MKKKIHKEIDDTITELIELVSSFDQAAFNLVPFEGSWTAGQLAKHLVMSNSGFIEIVNGPIRESNRAPDQMVEKIKNDFLNFSIKMKSPDFVVPPESNYEKEQLLGSLKDIKLKAIQAIDTLDLEKTCIAFELPVYGFLTRLEALHFILYHTQRHIQQLKNIHRKVVNKNEDALKETENP